MNAYLSIIMLVPVLAFGLALAAHAQVMESASYQIQSDSINLGGGLSTSTSYQLEDTAGEIATGPSESASYRLRAGYQQMDEVYLALSAAADVTMNPTLSGITGGTSYGTTTATATTDSAAGYQLSIKASSSPAMVRDLGSDSVADYAPGVTPSFAFSVAASEAVFAFTPEGADIVERFLDNGSACNTGSSETTGACFDGLSTSDATIASRASANHPDGTPTRLTFRVGLGANANKLDGTYTATTTLTLTAL